MAFFMSKLVANITKYSVSFLPAVIAFMLFAVSLISIPVWAHDDMDAFFDMSLEQLMSVVITAQKREEKLSEAPISVSVVTGSALSEQRLNNMEYIQGFAPSLSFGKGGTTRNSNLIMRGVGTVSFSVAAEPSVSTVVDGVVLARAGQAFADIYDVQRVEILRGPQGTLFGKNASAGLINIITGNPSDTPESTIDILLAQDNETRVQGMVSGPLWNKLSYRLAGFVNKFDGFVNNAHNDTRIYGVDRHGARLKLKYQPSEAFSTLLSLEHYQADDQCCAEVMVASDANGSLKADAVLSAGGEILGPDTRVTALDASHETIDKSDAITLQFDHQLNNMTFTSITALREWKNIESQDIDDSPLGPTVGEQGSSGGSANNTDLARDLGPQTWQQISQEFRLTSDSQTPLEWQLGSFFWHSEVDRTYNRFDTLCIDDPAGDFGGVDFTAQGLGFGDACPASNIVTPSASAVMGVEFDNFALFGQATYSFAEDFGITLGGRYTWDDVSYHHARERIGDEYVDQLGNNNGDPNDDSIGVFALQVDKAETSDSVAETNFSTKLVLHHNDSNALMSYASYTQGYKAPAFNVFFNMKDPENLPPISAETSDAYEIGFKWLFKAATFNIAIFKAYYQGFQANSFILTGGAVTTNLTNAGDVSTEGVEIDFVVQPNARLRLNGGVTFANAQIDNFDCSVANAVNLDCSNRSGEDLQFSPKVKGFVATEYLIPRPWANIIIASSMSFQSEMYAGGSENQDTRIAGHTLVNMSLALSLHDDAYRATLFVNNLFDEAYYTFKNGNIGRLARDGHLYTGVKLRARF